MLGKTEFHFCRSSIGGVLHQAYSKRRGAYQAHATMSPMDIKITTQLKLRWGMGQVDVDLPTQASHKHRCPGKANGWDGGDQGGVILILNLCLCSGMPSPLCT